MKLPAAARFQRTYASGGRRRAFSLVETVLALAIVSFALIGVLSLIPVGLGALKDSMNLTSNSLMISNVREMLVGQPCQPGNLGPFYYDADGRLQGSTQASDSLYRVDVNLAPPFTAIPNSNLLVATVKITWPVDGANPGKNSYETSYYVSPLTGPEWSVLDSSFTPKIDL